MTSSSSTKSAAAPGAVPRRAFLRAAGVTAASAGLLLAGCDTDEPEPAATPNTLSFGSSSDANSQVLNYLFFLKQLEFAFYDKVINAFPADVTAAEQAYLRDLRDHELVQRQVLGNVLGSGALSALPFDFASVTLTTRTGVLDAARKLEDTGSGAFLGIMPLLSNATLFALVAKMASVEARHAALVRDVQTPGSFAGSDVVTATGAQAGQGVALTPTQVAAVLQPFVPTLKIDLTSLPTA